MKTHNKSVLLYRYCCDCCKILVKEKKQDPHMELSLSGRISASCLEPTETAG